MNEQSMGKCTGYLLNVNCPFQDTGMDYWKVKELEYKLIV